MIQNMKNLMLIQFTDPFLNQLNHLHKHVQSIPQETEALDIDSLEYDINTDVEENCLHQEGIISEVPKAR